jgi:pimeloyl-ACP methyl ester carboxylesterase
LNALEALRRDDFHIVAGAPIETSEFVFSRRSVEEIRRISLSETGAHSFGERTLVVTRSDRPLSKRLRGQLSGDQLEWQTTDEQASLIDVDPMWAVLPQHTLDDIITWLCSPASTTIPFAVVDAPTSARVASLPDRLAVEEHFVQVGPQRLFGIVTEPVGPITGPFVVMFNVGNEEHTGPSRLWVELSRRWAGYGLRSVRFDLRGLGDSPWPPHELNEEFFFAGWLEDIVSVVRELNAEDVSNTVFIGLCSGAYWAIEAALELHAKGVCAINPPLYIDVLHSVRKLETSQHPRISTIGNRLKHFARRRWTFAKHRWVSAAAWHVTRIFLPRSYSEDILEKLGDNEIDLLLFYGVEEIWPYSRIPFFRSMDVRRLKPSSSRRVEYVPGLDHGMHSADGRTRTVNMLDEYVLEQFGGVASSTDSGTFFTEES